ncbi:arsenic resistance protein [Pseudogemmobacter sonorensis]|uniref:arsenic resistance protein n=1 Tax=Pseudogemmobacter sonorensis TaxID=2989681 RepID=UPI0036CC27D6
MSPIPTREGMERGQLWIYLLAILAGLGLGAVLPPGAGPGLEALLWPALALLLYATFAQAGLTRLPEAFRDRRLIAAALAGNFVALPLLVLAVLQLAPDDPPIRLGLLLVLLVPCTDWFLTFTHQAGGDLRRAIAITPALLLGQMLALPLYLWLFMGSEFAGPEFAGIVSGMRMAAVFLGVMALPLALAFATEKWAARAARGAALVARIGWAPVPLLALVLFLIAASQVEPGRGALPVLWRILPACLAFLAGAVLIGVGIGRGLGLPVAQARVLVFTFATRNSFVVLPFALALPPGWEAAAVTVIFQSLIELFAMLALLWLVPRWLLPDRTGE